MKEIIQKAIEGGFNAYQGVNRYQDDLEHEYVLRQSFWQALGKSCGWEGYSPHDVTAGEAEYLGDWVGNSMTFHEINLTEGWGKAVEYLSELVK